MEEKNPGLASEAKEHYLRAGKILADVHAALLPRLKPGAPLLEIAEFIESEIRKRGALPAFPANLSINEVAAHYTPIHQDAKMLQAGDLLKVDIGAHIDGYLADHAFTFCTEQSELIVAAEKAIENALQAIRPGVVVGEISQTIEETVKGMGLGLIMNLTGHGLDRHEFHAPPAIPNVATGSTYQLQEGDVIALEPFVAGAKAVVKDTAPVEIYRYLQDRPVRLPEARQMLDVMRMEYGSFPFAKRWLCARFSPFKVAFSLRQLEQLGAVESYAPLRHAGGGLVAQAEHTIIVADKPVVTTKPADD